MPRIRYSMSFTTGALLRRESLVVAEVARLCVDWSDVRQRVVGENLLQMRTLNASQRVYREVASRLQQLTTRQMTVLVDGSPQDQGHILWLAVCKRYRFIYDFAAEVLHEKFLRLDLNLTHADYDIFFNAKAEWHPEVDGVTDATRQKQRQIVFKMLREADLLTADLRILPALLSPRVAEAVREDTAAHFVIFPVALEETIRWA